MTTEIDLTIVKALIDRAFILKKEKELLLQQVNNSQNENENLKEQLTAKEDELKSQHKNLSLQLKQKDNHQQSKLAELAESHRVATESQEKTNQVDYQALKAEHEFALSSLANELSQKNTELSEALASSEQQNKALVSRIKGVES